MRLSVVPVFWTEEREIADVISLLSDVMRFEKISVKAQITEAPAGSFDRTRGQYKAEKLLDFISAMRKESDEILLGVTEFDLYYPGLNFVFGLAKPGDCAIISLCRLRQEFYGLRPDRNMFIVRAVKEAVHELGHVLHLSHCENRNCVMFFSNSIMDTDAKGYRFCPSCQKKL